MKVHDLEVVFHVATIDFEKEFEVSALLLHDWHFDGEEDNKVVGDFLSKLIYHPQVDISSTHIQLSLILSIELLF